MKGLKVWTQGKGLIKYDRLDGNKDMNEKKGDTCYYISSELTIDVMLLEFRISVRWNRKSGLEWIVWVERIFTKATEE